MRKLAIAALFLAQATSGSNGPVNAGQLQPEADKPFTVTKVTTLSLPWRIAVLPDGRMLITEKTGPVSLVTPDGTKTPLANVPPVLAQGQGGMLGVFLSPKYASDHLVYLTYSEPGEPATPGGPVRDSSLALARAKLTIGSGTASLDDLQVIWRQMPKGRGGQFGAAVAFSPDGRHLFLAVGDRQRMTPAQDPASELGKILRLTLDGEPAPGNPMAGKISASTTNLIAPPRDTEVAKTAPVVSTYTYPDNAPNLAEAETWASGFRTPYGLSFGPDGRLWELEHGPRGGDELNLVEAGKNYGWPLVSYGMNYNQVPIPSPDTLPGMQLPVIYWTPVIAPGNLTFYNGKMFPQWNGSALIAGLATQTLSRVTFDGKGGAKPAERWAMGFKVRDVAVAADGSLWLVEDANPGGLYKVTVK